MVFHGSLLIEAPFSGLFFGLLSILCCSVLWFVIIPRLLEQHFVLLLVQSQFVILLADVLSISFFYWYNPSSGPACAWPSLSRLPRRRAAGGGDQLRQSLWPSISLPVRPAVRPASPSLVPIVMVNSRRGSTQADSQQWGSGALAEVHKAEGGGGPRVPPGRSPSRVSQTFAECRVRAELAPALQLGLGSVATVIELGKVAEGVESAAGSISPSELAVSRRVPSSFGAGARSPDWVWDRVSASFAVSAPGDLTAVGRSQWSIVVWAVRALGCGWAKRALGRLFRFLEGAHPWLSWCRWMGEAAGSGTLLDVGEIVSSMDS